MCWACRARFDKLESPNLQALLLWETRLSRRGDTHASGRCSLYPPADECAEDTGDRAYDKGKVKEWCEEEKEADQKLTQIAESSINWEAEEGETEGEEEEEGEGEMATAGAARSSGRAATARSKSSTGGRSRSKKR